MDRPVIAYRPVRSEIYDSHLPNIVSRQVDGIGALIQSVDDALAGEEVNGGAAGAAAAQYYAAMGGVSVSARVLDVIDQLDLNLAQPIGRGHRLGLASGYVRIPARSLARRILRPGAAAYGRQKFPGLGLDEIQRELVKLGAASGCFAGVRVAPLAHQCYSLAA